MKKLEKKQPVEQLFQLEHFSDIHIHTSPDVKPRLLNDIEAAWNAKKEKMDFIVLKAHHESTSGRAKIASTVTGLPVFGGVVLNNSVGGINPEVAKASAKLGGKFIWLPTVSYSKIRIDWKSVEEILQVAAENDMVIATGHLKPDDIFTLIDMARNMGIWRLVVNHPLTRVVGASIDEQVEMARHAFLEHCYVACMEKHDGLDPKIIINSIKKIGADRCIMATDFGQIHNQSPVDGMKMFVGDMREGGVSNEDISKMCIKNPQKLIL